MEVTVPRAWIVDSNVGTIGDEQFRSIAHCLGHPRSSSPPSTTSTRNCILWESVKWFWLEENALLWLHGDFEQKQVEENARATRNDNDEEMVIPITAKGKEDEHNNQDRVEITVRANSKEEDRNANI
jgi:hypothetical protein